MTETRAAPRSRRARAPPRAGRARLDRGAVATAAGERRRPAAALQPWEGDDAARAADRAVHEPRRRARPRHHAARVGRRRRRGARASRCARARPARRRPARDRRGWPARPRARSSSPTPTSSPSARCSPGCSPSRAWRPAILSTGGPVARPYGFKTRARRGRIVSAGSPYHAVRKPTGTFLGVLKVAPADRPGVAAIAERLAGARRAAPAPDWQEELGAQGAALAPRCSRCSRCDRERRATPRRRARCGTPPCCRRRTPPSSSAGARCAPDDVTALLLVGLIRAGVHVGRRTCARCSGRGRCRRRRSSAPRARSREHDEDRELLNAAVKGSDGFFTTFFVCPTRSTSRAGPRTAG